MPLTRCICSLIYFLLISTAWADQGLLSTNDSRIPEAVRRQLPSVFRVVVLTEAPDGKVPRIPGERYREIEERFSDDGFMGDFLRKRGKHYRESGENLIPVEISGIGTGFLIGDGKRLVTVMHYFRQGTLEQTFMRLRRATTKAEIQGVVNDLTGGKVHFLLLDQKGTTVFDTRKPSDIALLKAMPDLRKPYRTPPGPLKALAIPTVTFNDLLLFELNRKLAEPLQFREKSPEAGDEIFAPGFPIKTSDRMKKYRAEDANGFDMVCSVGKIIESQAIGDFIQPALENAAEANDLVAATREKLLLGDNDGEEGMSGGPVLDRDGRLVSIQRMSFRESDFVGAHRRPVHDDHASLSVMLRSETFRSSLNGLEKLLSDVVERAK